MKQLIAITVTILFLVGAAFADGPDFAKVTFTEDFYVGNTPMPAGAYIIRLNSVNHSVNIARRDGPSVFAHVNDVMAKGEMESTHFRFLRVEGKLVLHQIALQGDRHIHDLVHSKGVPELK